MLHRRLLPLLVFALLALTACQPAAPAAPGAAAAAGAAAQPPTPVPTATFTPEPTITPTIPPQLITPTQPAQVIGPFEAMLDLDWGAPGFIMDLFAEDEETVWLTAYRGAARLHVPSETFQQTKFEAPANILGLQLVGDGARLWLIRWGGFTVSAWDGEGYADYDRQDGWILRAEEITAPIEESFAVSSSGQVWISTARDVRRFDGTRWRVFTATELGLPYIRQAGLTSSYVVGLRGEEAWAGSCNWRGDVPLGEGGLHRFDGQRWVDSGLPVEDACVTAIRTDGQSRVWAGVSGSLWRYTPLSGEWVEFPPELLEDEQVLGYVPEVAIDPNGDAWPLFVPCDLVNCHAGQIRYHVLNGEWQEILRLEHLESHRLVFNGAGPPWIFMKEGIYQVQPEGALLEVADLNADHVTRDLRGNLWMVTKYRTDPTLWRYLAP